MSKLVEQIQNLRAEIDKMQQMRDQLVENLRLFRSTLQQEVDREQADNAMDLRRSSHQLRESNQNFVDAVRRFVTNLRESSDSTRKSFLEERETVYAKGILDRRLEIRQMQSDIMDIRRRNLDERAQMHNIWFGTT